MHSGTTILKLNNILGSVKVLYNLLDYFLVSHSLTDLISWVSIDQSYRSDHSIIEVNPVINKFIKVKGIWMFNCRLPSEQDYLKKVKSIIKEDY